jgi:hypothetical protein
VRLRTEGTVVAKAELEFSFVVLIGNFLPEEKSLFVESTHSSALSKPNLRQFPAPLFSRI